MHVYSEKHRFLSAGSYSSLFLQLPSSWPSVNLWLFIFHTQMFDLQKVMEKNQKEQTKAKTLGVRLAWSLQWIVA